MSSVIATVTSHLCHTRGTGMRPGCSTAAAVRMVTTGLPVEGRGRNQSPLNMMLGETLS